MGVPYMGETGQSTGNDQCTSYGLVSGDFRLLMTAPYSQVMASQGGSPSPEDAAPSPFPSFSSQQAHDFFRKHGLAARAIGLEVKDATSAFEKSVANRCSSRSENQPLSLHVQDRKRKALLSKAAILLKWNCTTTLCCVT